MLSRLGILAVAVTAACASAPREPRAPAPGMITGLIRDAATGSGIENATIELRSPGHDVVRDRTDDNGAYMVPLLPPGQYTVTALIGKSPIAERTAEVRAGEVTGLDFAVGSLAVDAADLDKPGAPKLWRYRPSDADPSTATIEGTVSDLRQLRIPGAVVSVTSSGTVITEQTVTDDRGRFTIGALAPGHYDVVAYYAVLQRGQIEVRRNRVRVDGGEVVEVPFWLDTAAR